MTAPVLPDGYIGGNKDLVTLLAAKQGVPTDRIGDYIVIMQRDLPDLDWSILVGPDVPIGMLPVLFRRMADEVENRVHRLPS